MLAYYIDHFNPFIVEFAPGIGLRWYGTAYVAAFLVAWWMLKWFARHGYSELPENKIDNFIAGVALFGVLLGGRLGYALFYDPGMFREPLSLLRVWDGGMASHGGMLGVFLFVLGYAWRHKISPLGLGDNLVVVAPLGIFFGRCANFINGELYGRPTTVPWAVQFPHELLDPRHRDLAAQAVAACEKFSLDSPGAIVHAAMSSEPVRDALAGILTPRHPSQLYAALLEGLLLFIALWLLRTRTRVPMGVTSGAFFLLYAAGRIFGEQFREPDAYVAFTLGLTRGQFLSTFMILIGIALIGIAYWRRRSGKHRS